MLKKHGFGPFLCRDTIMILFFSEKTVSELSQNKVQIFFSSFIFHKLYNFKLFLLSFSNEDFFNPNVLRNKK
jgi:hypothetical protein